MGLDAIVRCTCFAQGLTSPPPVPITLDEWGLPELRPGCREQPVGLRAVHFMDGVLL